MGQLGIGATIRIWKNQSTGELADCQRTPVYDESNLVFDCNTLIVYYKYHDGTFSSPYISENGKYCRFIGGKIVEVG